MKSYIELSSLRFNRWGITNCIIWDILVRKSKRRRDMVELIDWYL